MANYYLYVYAEDMTGRHVVVHAKPFSNEADATDEARTWSDMPGYHVYVVSCNTVIYDR